MFSYIWSKGALISETSHLSSYKIESVVPLYWREHCLECAMPLCYKSCPLYKKRKDGRCLRFDEGIIPVEFDSFIGKGAKISFRRWAKLQTNFPVHSCLFSKRSYNSYLNNFLRIEKVAVFISDLLHNYRLSQVVSSLLERFNTKRFEANDPVADGFLSIIKNISEQEKTLILELIEDNHSIFKTSIILKQGWNETFIPIDKIKLPSSKAKKAQLRAYISNDETATLIFELFDLVKLVKSNKNIGPASKVKCVAWDLDNTLWEGVIGDDGGDNVIPYKASIQLIKDLDERGIIQTIVSKNTEKVAWEKIESLGLCDYFLYPAINWGRKSQSLKCIAKELNINIDTFAVIDDSIFERNEIKTNLPQVRVFDVTEIPNILLLPEFDMPITEATKKRRESYLSEYKRKNISANWDGDYDSFLISCNIELEIFKPETNDEKERCLELISRSNQYNISGIRYDKEEFYNLLNSYSHDCYAFKVKDDFGDYGIVGFASFKKEALNYNLNDFVMSCRVALKKIERAFFSAIIDKYKTQYSVLNINAIKTDRNLPLREQLLDMPFEVIAETDTELTMVFNMSDSFINDNIVYTKLYV